MVEIWKVCRSIQVLDEGVSLNDKGENSSAQKQWWDLLLENPLLAIKEIVRAADWIFSMCGRMFLDWILKKNTCFRILLMCLHLEKLFEWIYLITICCWIVFWVADVSPTQWANIKSLEWIYVKTKFKTTNNVPMCLHVFYMRCSLFADCSQFDSSRVYNKLTWICARKIGWISAPKRFI